LIRLALPNAKIIHAVRDPIDTCIFLLLEVVQRRAEPHLSFHKTERPVCTASATQVRQPIYNSAIGRWRVYEQHLGPLLDALDRNRATPGSQTSGAPDEIRTPDR
jgi:hypothetical protein